MRRLAVVGAAEAAGRDTGGSAALRAWMGALPSAGAQWLDRLADVALEQVDVLWVRQAIDPDGRLIAWLRAGGRLLATQAAVGLVSPLGLEPVPPTEISLPDPLQPAFGLAGFGAHPLFAGLRDGATLATDGHLARILTGYERTWPSAAVVAVERRGLALDPERVLAWEYAIGSGGMTCLAVEPIPLDGPGDDELVLANALVGEGIPHRDRIGAVVHWPRPARRVTRETGAERVWPAMPALSPAWDPSSLPALDLAPAADWVHAGRRQLIRARAATGEREVWAPPFRVMAGARVRDAISCAPGHIAADEVAGGLALGGHRLLERWLAGADAPVAVWEVAGPEGVDVALEWTVDFRRAWPYPPGCYGDISFEVSADRRTLWLRAEGGPVAGFTVSGGALAAEPGSGLGIVRVTCIGATPVSVAAVAGADADELSRACKALEGGVQELAASRARRAAQLERYGTVFESQDDQLGRGFAWSRQRGDEALIGVPGVGRSLLTGCPRSAEEGAWCFGAHAAAAAAAQLIAGHRDPAREVLKFLAQTQARDGGIAAQLPIGGLGAPPDAASTIAFLRLAERLMAWTGDLESFRRLRGPLAGAVSYLAARADAAPSTRVLDGIEPLLDGPAAVASMAELRRRAGVEPAPAVEPHAVVEAAAAALRRSPGALVGSDAGPALLEGVAALWGFEPDAPEDALSIAPVVPAGWPGHALRGLRVGRSVLDLAVRRRPDAMVVRVTHRFGPRLVVTVAAPGLDAVGAEVDDITLPAGRVRFEAHDRHEVRFHLAG